MANKLKKIELNSVDLTRCGANQQADIRLFKSDTPQEAVEQPTAAEKNIFKRFLNWLHEQPAGAATAAVAKDYASFDQINTNRESNDLLWRYTDALNTSIRSIQEDHDLNNTQKADMMRQSLQQFSEAMSDLIGKLAGIESPALIKSDRYDEIEEVHNVKKK